LFFETVGLVLGGHMDYGKTHPEGFFGNDSSVFTFKMFFKQN